MLQSVCTLQCTPSSPIHIKEPNPTQPVAIHQLSSRQLAHVDIRLHPLIQPPIRDWQVLSLLARGARLGALHKRDTAKRSKRSMPPEHPLFINDPRLRCILPCRQAGRHQGACSLGGARYRLGSFYVEVKMRGGDGWRREQLPYRVMYSE